MSLADEIYMKHNVSELKDLDEHVVKLWKEGRERHLQRILDGVGGYGSSGRKPLPKEYWDELEVDCE